MAVVDKREGPAPEAAFEVGGIKRSVGRASLLKRKQRASTLKARPALEQGANPAAS